MKKLLAAAALATVALSGASGTAQAGYYGHSYGYAPSYSAPSYSTYVEQPVYHVYRPRYVKRYVVKRHYAPSYSHGYHGY